MSTHLVLAGRGVNLSFRVWARAETPLPVTFVGVGRRLRGRGSVYLTVGARIGTATGSIIYLDSATFIRIDSAACAPRLETPVTLYGCHERLNLSNRALRKYSSFLIGLQVPGEMFGKRQGLF